VTDVMAGATAGDPGAWRDLTDRFGGMVMAIARSCRLNEADVAEVHQVTWLRLVENIDRINQPDRIGGWLATTARRESLRIVRSKARLSLDHDMVNRLPDTESRPLDARLLSDESAELVQEAFARLPAHCQRLLGILSGDDPPSYKEVSRMISMPIGSIGPTRGRCLEHLRRIMEELDNHG
jgi:RNA polymerase sigma factor (sigma-70 family)